MKNGSQNRKKEKKGGGSRHYFKKRGGGKAARSFLLKKSKKFLDFEEVHPEDAGRVFSEKEGGKKNDACGEKHRYTFMHWDSEKEKRGKSSALRTGGGKKIKYTSGVLPFGGGKRKKTAWILLRRITIFHRGSGHVLKRGNVCVWYHTKKRGRGPCF